ncbi:hypothetical protein [Pseudomonas sp. RL_5y_Pfl2_69]|uniref:hypothetical protein n=1 Tax=Pseudomonas sp. RL_5y_Pfl2_69 TaxID=3088711 RepID=UPI0030DCF9C6
MSKIAVKCLTSSDLTLFTWHFDHTVGSRQIAINLNADVFIKKLYPELPVLAKEGRSPFHLDLSIYGPGQADVHSLKKQIISKPSKNWRLCGPAIANPSDEPKRYNYLASGDYAIMRFDGETEPTELTMTLVSASLEKDETLHAELHKLMAGRSMAALSSEELAGLGIEAALEDAALCGIDGQRQLAGWTSSRKIDKAELERARERANATGQKGEEFVDYFLSQEQADGRIQTYQWASLANAIEAFDFKVNDSVLIDVKSTTYSFQQKLHISLNELLHMRDHPYHLYRIYGIQKLQAKLRICANVRELAVQTIQILEKLPFDIKVDSVSLSPDCFEFGEEILLILPESTTLPDSSRPSSRQLCAAVDYK